MTALRSRRSARTARPVGRSRGRAHHSSSGLPARAFADPREDEQQVRQAVHVDKDVLLHRAGPEADDRTLGPAAYRPGHVERRAGLDASGKNEAAQRWQLRLRAVDPPFQPRHIVGRHRRLGDALRDPVRRIGKTRPEREQIALNLFDHGGELRIGE